MSFNSFFRITINCIKKNSFLIALLAVSPLNTIGQNNVDELVAMIDNNRLKFDVAKVGAARFVDSNKVILPKILVFVTSVDIKEIVSKIGKNKLVIILLPLLADTTKDWYTNVLLYQITQREASPLIVVESRKDWIKYYREIDLAYWKKYPNLEQTETFKGR